jgi:quinolinate synthase
MEVRRNDPAAAVVAHPECPEEVIELVDASGSTGFIVRYVEDAPEGAHIAIATEINLIKRLAKNHPGKKVYEGSRSLCPNMYKIGLDDLCFTLEHLGEVNVIEVADDIVRHSRVALERMLRLV